MTRHGWISTHADVSQKCQCMLAGVSCTTAYIKRKAVLFVEVDEVLKQLIDEEHTRHPFYGSRKIVVYLGGLRTMGQPQAGAALHAQHVAGWDGTRAEYEHGAYRSIRCTPTS
jgi:putative transposase